MEKPTLPKGTRDFGPATMAKRQFIFNSIRTVFQKFGFQPLETPSMENLSTLTGKYGEEGDQLLFKILNTGNFLDKLKKESGAQLIRDRVRIEDFLKEKINDLLSAILQSPDNKDQSIKTFIDNLSQSEELKQTGIYEVHLRNILNTRAKDFSKYIVIINFSGNSIEKATQHASHINSIVTNILNELELDNNFIKSGIVYNSLESKKTTKYIAEKGLRYDLTVPFARYVVMNRHEITFPFKRYQIQPVWRADNPQKGRYREFYQCDADVVGTDSLICETEIILMIREVFARLGLTDYSIKINHRGILSGIAELVCSKENETSLFVAIDKLDKFGEEKVREELLGKGFEKEKLDVLFEILNYKGDTTAKINFMSQKFSSATGQKGIADLQEVLNLLKNYNTNTNHVEFDIALARGLSYYTGCIFEVKVNHVSIGSVSGGGRYDNLTKAFGDKENLPGVGFSFGVDRLYDVLEELKLFPKESQVSSKVFICHFDEDSFRYGLGVLSTLREAGISSEIYPDQSKLKKQLEYANKKMIPFTIVIGSDEMKSGELPLKNMETGEQEKLALDQILVKLA